MSENAEHRDYWRRQHRILAHYLAHEAWVRGLDCVALERHHLSVFLGLQRFKRSHIEWLCSDVSPWFPHYVTYERKSSSYSLHSIFLSRLPISDFLSGDELHTEDRISRIPCRAPKTAMLVAPDSDDDFPDETNVLSRLAHLAAGLIEPI